MSTSSGSVAMHEPRTVQPRRRAIVAVVLAVAFGTGIFVGRASAPSDDAAPGQNIASIDLTAKDLRDPVAALHRRIYAHFPDLGDPAPLDLGDLSDPFAALHRQIYAHLPRE
jgi:hypothetical protein